MNKFLGLLLAGFLPVAVGASDVTLNEFTKGQTGVYFVSPNEQESTLASTGVLLEVFIPDERVLPTGEKTDTTLIFSGFYNRRGEYFVVSGPAIGNVASVDVNKVFVDTDGSNKTRKVGIGLLEADPLDMGHSDIIDYTLVVDADVLGTDDADLEKADRVLTGRLHRASNVFVRACVPVEEEASENASEGVVDDIPEYVDCNRFNNR